MADKVPYDRNLDVLIHEYVDPKTPIIVEVRAYDGGDKKVAIVRQAGRNRYNAGRLTRIEAGWVAYLLAKVEWT